MKLNFSELIDRLNNIYNFSDASDVDGYFRFAVTYVDKETGKKGTFKKLGISKGDVIENYFGDNVNNYRITIENLGHAKPGDIKYFVKIGRNGSIKVLSIPTYGNFLNPVVRVTEDIENGEISFNAPSGTYIYKGTKEQCQKFIKNYKDNSPYSSPY